jgi:hypothetical protein
VIINVSGVLRHQIAVIAALQAEKPAFDVRISLTDRDSVR